jgi:pyridoxal phosphate enzyme (YggS family)
LLIDNLNQIRYRIHDAAKRVNRDAASITLVAVTKYAQLSDVHTLIDSGLICEIGENRVLDAEKKKALLGDTAAKVRWHLIGHLQTNKIKKALSVFNTIDSVDSEKLASALDAAAAAESRTLDIMVQVKLTDRVTQSGIAPNDLETFLALLARYPHLNVKGLMGIAPALEPLEAVRPSFKTLRALRDQFLPHGKLSMGMSRDFEIAIEEGSDMIRIGSQIFSQHSPASLEAPA